MSDFPKADITFRRIKVKATIVCEYELNDLDDYEAVKQNAESALCDLRAYGSAVATYEVESTDVGPQ